MTYKHIILKGQGVMAFKEAKPEMPKAYKKSDKDSVINAFGLRVELWEKSGIDIEFYPGEEEKMKAYVIRENYIAFVHELKEALEQGIDITDFCEIREAVCRVAQNDNLCPNISCQKYGYCCDHLLYAFFKAPVETEQQRIDKLIYSQSLTVHEAPVGEETQEKIISSFLECLMKLKQNHITESSVIKALMNKFKLTRNGK